MSVKNTVFGFRRRGSLVVYIVSEEHAASIFKDLVIWFGSKVVDMFLDSYETMGLMCPSVES